MSDTQLVIFELDGQDYGVEMNYVFSINRIKDCKVVKIPNTPNYVEGVFNLRNRVIPLYNLRKKFMLNNENDKTIGEIMIVNVDKLSVGLMVDEVIDIVKLSDQDTEEAPDIISGMDNKYIKSIGKLNGDMIIILDTCRILSDREYNQLESGIRV